METARKVTQKVLTEALMSSRQLRFYFKNMVGANITATPNGYYTDTEGLSDAVINAYGSMFGV